MHAIEHAALDPYTPDGYVQALEQAIAQLTPEQVFLPHTYQTRDFAPKLAGRGVIRGPRQRSRGDANSSTGRKRSIAHPLHRLVRQFGRRFGGAAGAVQ